MRRTAETILHALLWGVVIGASAFLALRMSAWFDQPSFHWDARYLMSAADCLAKGASPYRLDAFFVCWEARTQTPPRASYVFPPHSLLFAFPLAFFDRPAADVLLLTMNGAVFVVLGAWSVMLLRLGGGQDLARWTSVFWLLLALTNTGILGSVYLGQFSLLAGTGLVGLALVVAGAAHRPWTVGLLMAMVKPHLSLLAVLFALLHRGRAEARRKALALGVLVAVSLLIFLVDPGFPTSYREALALHSASQYSGVSTPEALFGLPGMLTVLTPFRALIAIAVAAAMVTAIWLLDTRPRHAHDATLAAFSVAVILGTMMFPHKSYDFAAYSVVFLVAARQPLAVQGILLLPLAVVWRPVILDRLDVDQITGTNVALIGLAAGFAALAASAYLHPARRVPPPAE